MPKWKYPDPKLKSPKEKWYENVPDDPELEKWLYSLIHRHSIQANSRGLSLQMDAALVPVLMKLVHLKQKLAARQAAEEWAAWVGGMDSVPWPEDIEEELRGY